MLINDITFLLKSVNSSVKEAKSSVFSCVMLNKGLLQLCWHHNIIMHKIVNEVGGSLMETSKNK